MNLRKTVQVQRKKFRKLIFTTVVMIRRSGFVWSVLTKRILTIVEVLDMGVYIGNSGSGGRNVGVTRGYLSDSNP